MATTLHPENELAAATAFNRQSGLFDGLYAGDTIIQYKRKRVRDHVIPYLKPGSNILELNAGTGEDAVYFAQLGYMVHATDISGGMQQVLINKIAQYGLNERISRELCSFTALETLHNKGPYDLVFSNFAGLNCTDRLNKVLGDVYPLLKPGGVVTMVLLPRFCLWESLLLFKGKFRTATRRLFSSKGRKAHIEGTYFRCWYYNPSYILHALKDSFHLLSIEGLCTLVPPSYLQGFPEKYPKAYTWLSQKESRLKDKWPWKYIGDYYIISLRKI